MHVYAAFTMPGLCKVAEILFTYVIKGIIRFMMFLSWTNIHGFFLMLFALNTICILNGNITRVWIRVLISRYGDPRNRDTKRARI
jgi:hypothetical protein